MCEKVLLVRWEIEGILRHGRESRRDCIDNYLKSNNLPSSIVSLLTKSRGPLSIAANVVIYTRRRGEEGVREGLIRHWFSSILKKLISQHDSTIYLYFHSL